MLMSNVKRKCQVVLLSTDQKQNSLKGYTDKSLLFNFQKEYKTIEAEKGLTNHFHIYILSDDEIKDDDYCMSIDINSKLHKPFKCVNKEAFINPEFLNSVDAKDVKKIIATTDRSLKIFNPHYDIGELSRICLPTVSQLFINKFIQEYNKGNIITDVLVEYEDVWVKVGFSMDVAWVPKVNQKNIITISKVKQNFTREEVENLFLELQFDMAQRVIKKNNENIIPTFWLKDKFKTI